MGDWTNMNDVPVTGRTIDFLRSAVAITASDTAVVAPGISFLVICTVAGNVKVGMADGSTLTIPVAVGLTQLPWSVAQVFVTGTTATATYFNMK
jgi:hypothetical protein